MDLLLPIKDLWRLIFPKVCIACNLNSPMQEDVFCLECKMEAPYTDHFDVLENEFKTKFTARITLESATSLLYFSKSGMIQETLHKLKYRGKRVVGFAYGKEFGYKFIKSNLPKPDMIIPVPLHIKKEHLRGYNQALVFAQGIADITNIKISNRHLIKIKHTDTQTNKSRLERFDNVLQSFKVNHPYDLKNKHIMIVDDVSTTGATLEACAVKLSNIPAIKISFGIIALAQ